MIFRVDEGLRTLMDFRYQRHFKADKGIKGRNKSQHGANADHMIVRIPPGTVLIDDDTQEILADLTRHGQQVVVARGGRGGRGIPGLRRRTIRHRSWLRMGKRVRSVTS